MKIGSLHISPEMLRLIAELDEFKGGWRAMTTLRLDRRIRMQSYKMES